jgi:hypothetical protein
MWWHPPPENSFLPVLRECFLKKKEFATECSFFIKLCHLLALFNKKEEERDWLGTRQQEVSWFSRPAWTSTHQHTSWEFCPLDGVGFLIQWLNVPLPLLTFGADLFFGFFFILFCRLFFFPSTFRSPAQLYTPYLLGPIYWLRTNSNPPSHVPTY